MPIYPIHTRILEDFLDNNGFTPYIDCKEVIFIKGEFKTYVPHLKRLSRLQVINVLSATKLSIKTFEAYYMNLQNTREFDNLIDLSENTLKV